MQKANVSFADTLRVLEQFFCQTAAPGVVSAFLFGSVAEGRSHRESDIDVGVLLSRDVYATERERFDAGVRLSSEIVGTLGKNAIDVVVLNDAPPHLARRIVTSGRRVFSAAPEVERDFVRDTQLRAADLEPFLRRTRRLKLGAIGG
jgi:predicted nucleotidyltransferase